MRMEKIYKAKESLCITTKKAKKKQKKKLNSNTKFL